mgnify:CR=1 FL=1
MISSLNRGFLYNDSNAITTYQYRHYIDNKGIYSEELFINVTKNSKSYIRSHTFFSFYRNNSNRPCILKTTTPNYGICEYRAETDYPNLNEIVYYDGTRTSSLKENQTIYGMTNSHIIESVTVNKKSLSTRGIYSTSEYTSSSSNWTLLQNTGRFGECTFHSSFRWYYSNGSSKSFYYSKHQDYFLLGYDVSTIVSNLATFYMNYLKHNINQ